MPEPVQIHIMRRHLQIEVSAARDGPIEIHIDQGRKDMEIMQRHNAVVHIVIAVHAREQVAAIASLVKMDIAHHRWIVQRSCNRDDVVHVAGDWLIRCDQRRDVLHAGPCRIDLQLHTALPSEADRPLYQPGFLPAIFHGEGIDPHAIEAAADRPLQGMIWLLKKLTLRS